MSPPTASFNFDQLAALVASLFSADELRRVLGFWPAGRPLGLDVARGGATAEAIAGPAVQEMQRLGLIDALFLLMQEKRPLRRDEIDAVQRRWLVHRQAEEGAPPVVLPLSAEMERILQFAEGDESLVHRETTSLHLLYGLLAVPAGYDVQARLIRLLPPERLVRALRSLSRAEPLGVPEGVKITRQDYERLWAQANDLAVRRSGVLRQYPDMLLAVCMLRPNAIGEYLHMNEVTWDAFTRAVRGGEPVSPEEAHYGEVFAAFVALKRECGEPVDNLSLEAFCRKLRANAALLRMRPEVVEVRFEPYVKDGKAALRAAVAT